MGRVAYDMNHVIQDVEGLHISPQPPLPDELEVLSEASDSRPGTTSVEPSPGAGLTEDSDRGIEADVDRAEDIVAISSESSSDDEGTMFATLATVKTGTHLSDYGSRLRYRRARRPEPVCFVNSVATYSGRPCGL